MFDMTTSTPATVRISPEPPEPPPYRELFVCWASTPGEDFPYDHDAHDGPCEWGWVCNQDGCLTRLDDNPCLHHAPKEIPGLRLVECRTEPRHWLFSHDRDDYGHYCPACWADEQSAKLHTLTVAAEIREHRWCWLLHAFKWLGCKAFLLRPTGYMFSHACRPHVRVTWRWKR